MKTVLIAAAALVVTAAAFLAGRYLFAPLPPTGFDRKSVSLEVFNGCGVPRIARAVADELLRRGFDVYEIGNCDQAHEQTAVLDLRDPGGARAQAVAVELAVRRRFWGIPLREQDMPLSRVELDSSRHVDLRVVVGGDYRTFFPGLAVLR